MGRGGKHKSASIFAKHRCCPTKPKVLKSCRTLALSALTTLAVLSATPASAAWIETGEVIESRPGVKLMYVVTTTVNADKSVPDPKTVKNIVLLLTGGPGAIPPASAGIKEHKPDRVALRGYFAEKLGVVVAVGLPSDQSPGLSLEWRETKEHAQDISAVMDVVMKQYPGARITVLGFSNGCRSAAHVSAAARKRWGTSLQGVVMLSCSAEAFRDDWMAALRGPLIGTSEFPKVPVLVVHHKRDSCLYFENVEMQAKWFDFITVDDTKLPRPNVAARECGNGSAHQFSGKEQKVYQAVVDWINTGKTNDLKY